MALKLGAGRCSCLELFAGLRFLVVSGGAVVVGVVLVFFGLWLEVDMELTMAMEPPRRAVMGFLGCGVMVV